MIIGKHIVFKTWLLVFSILVAGYNATQHSKGVLSMRPMVLPASPSEVKTVEKPDMGTRIPSASFKRSRVDVMTVEVGSDGSDDEDKILHRVKRQQHITKQTKSDNSPLIRKSPRLPGKPIKNVDDEGSTLSLLSLKYSHFC